MRLSGVLPRKSGSSELTIVLGKCISWKQNFWVLISASVLQIHQLRGTVQHLEARAKAHTGGDLHLPNLPSLDPEIPLKQSLEMALLRNLNSTSLTAKEALTYSPRMQRT